MIDIDKIISELDQVDESELLRLDLEAQEKKFKDHLLSGTNFPDERKRLLEAFEAGQAFTGKNGLRRQLAAFDLAYFAQAYLPHYFKRNSPEFHKELDSLWFSSVMKETNPHLSAKEINEIDGRFRAIAAPRGHAKSTNVTFKDTLHAVVYAYKNYILILSDSSEQAEGFLSDIMSEIESNEALKEDFGILQGKKVWKSSVALTSSNIKIEAIGSGKKVRGRRHRIWRPDLIVLDDVENDENVRTIDQRNKLDNWFKKAVSKAGDTYTDIFYIGTVLHFDSLLVRTMKNPRYKSVIYKGVISEAVNKDLWDIWESIYTDLTNDDRLEDAKAFFEGHKEEMLEGTEVLWEERLSYYKLMETKVSEGEAAFNSEIQNNPIDPSSCTFNEEWLDFYDDPSKPILDFSDSRYVIIGAVDPSLGKTDKSDTSAIIVLIKDIISGYMYVAEASIEKRKADIIIEDALESSKRMKRDFKKSYHQFGVETVQFQYFFKDVLAEKSRLCGEYLPIEEINSLQNKRIRIESLQPFIKNGYLKFSHKHKTLVQQILNYPHGNDDGPDALEMAVRLALTVKGTKGIEYKSVISRAMRFKRGAY